MSSKQGEVVKHPLWMRGLLDELGIKQTVPAVLRTDSQTHPQSTIQTMTVPNFDEKVELARTLVLRKAKSRQFANIDLWKQAFDLVENKMEEAMLVFGAFESSQYVLYAINAASKLVDFLLSLSPTFDLFVLLVYVIWLSNGAEDEAPQCSFTNRPKDKPDKPPDWKFTPSSFPCLCKANVEIAALRRKLEEQEIELKVVTEQLADSKTIIFNLQKQARTDQACSEALTTTVAAHQRDAGVEVAALHEELIALKVLVTDLQKPAKTEEFDRKIAEGHAQLELDSGKEDLKQKKVRNALENQRYAADTASDHPRTFWANLSHYWTNRNKVSHSVSADASVGGLFTAGVSSTTQYTAPAGTT